MNRTGCRSISVRAIPSLPGKCTKAWPNFWESNRPPPQKRRTRTLTLSRMKGCWRCWAPTFGMCRFRRIPVLMIRSFVTEKRRNLWPMARYSGRFLTAGYTDAPREGGIRSFIGRLSGTGLLSKRSIECCRLLPNRQSGWIAMPPEKR